MPAFRHPRPKPFLSEDKQDSQDNYGLLELDLDDAELLAALGEDQFSSRAIDNKSKDERVCKVNYIPDVCILSHSQKPPGY
jgi:hypothetical protein